jgi:SAM-dependent methyltransferase
VKSTLTLDQKYDYYERSVQNAEAEVEFMHEQYKAVYKRSPFTMREDFCGTGAISCKWVEQDKRCRAYGIDLDPEPVEMGKKRHYAKLKAEEKKRIDFRLENVLKTKAPKVDVVCAFNFSYFIFHTRKEMLAYFKSVHKSLNKEGIFFLDIFGGPDSQKIITDTKKLKNLTYYWECQKFNPITHRCLFAIHFRDAKGKKHSNVFTYDWRFWMLPEIRDLLSEAGFSEVKVYWEGDDDDGGGNGVFTESTDGENCDAWVAYIGAIP